MVNDAILLQSIEGLGDPPSVARSGEIWQLLQDERLDVSQRLLDDGAMPRQTLAPELGVSAEVARELEWRHRQRLELRLRQLTEAQDRLLEGHYGRCTDCGEDITARRLAADPAAALCYSCETATDQPKRFCSL
jgi:RNA polymerase-binding transcription factor DksA